MLYSVRKGLSSFVCFPPFSAFFFLVFFRIEGICGSNRVRLALFHFAVKKSSKFSKTENCLVFALNNFFSSLRKEMKTFLLLRKTSSSSSSSFRRYCYYSLSRRQTLRLHALKMPFVPKPPKKPTKQFNITFRFS